MTPTPPNAERNGVTVSPLFIIIAAVAALSTAALAAVFTSDIGDPVTPAPDRSTLAGLIVCATAWIGLFCVGLRDAMRNRTVESEADRCSRFDTIEEKLAEMSTTLDAFRRQNDKALMVIHDEVNRFSEGHTQEFNTLTATILAWGEEQKTEGELAGHRRAVGKASVDRAAGARSVQLVRPTS